MTIEPIALNAPRKGKPPQHLADLTPPERADVLRAAGGQPWRAKQIARHYFVHLSTDPDTMTDLPAAGRGDLVRALLPTLLTEARSQIADGGQTRKTLWRLFDDATIESVLMRYPGRTTVCISSQSGCGMACPFCATGQLGLRRNLSAAEICEQVRLSALAARDGLLAGGPTRLSNVVLMGMGEPLVNYRNVVHAIRAMTSPDGFGLSARSITVSTCGLVPAIERLASEGLPVTLALSLHAPDDKLRDTLVPINRHFSVAKVLDAAHGYYQRTGRRISIEYALMRDINDQADRARSLARQLTARGSGWVHVNPIPLNPTPGSKWTASRPEVEREFVDILLASGIPTTVRDTRGRDIDGACGQLAAEESEHG